MRIAVTGAAGFVGSNLCHKLWMSGYDVTGVDNLQFGYEDNLPKDMPFKKYGIDAMYYVLNDYDIIVSCHTANIIYAMTNPMETWHTNCADTIEMFGKFNGKIIYTSTSSIYGNAPAIPTPEDSPLNMTNSYARSKYAPELFLRDRGNYTTLRLTNTYGRFQRPDHPYSGIIGKMVGAALNGEKIKIYGDGSQTRDFIYVDDVVDAIIKAIELPALNTEINIGTGKETSVIDVANEIALEIPDMQEWEFVDGRPIDNITRRCLDIKKAEQLLDWSPRVNLREGIKRTIEWLSSTPTTYQK